MYLAMTQNDFEQVVEEAPRIVAIRLGLAVDQEQARLRSEINKTDPLAAGLLDKFIEVYTEWWTTSSAAIQGESRSNESAKVIQRLIDKRGQMRTALMNYLNSQYPTYNPEHPLDPDRQSSGDQGKANRIWQRSISRTGSATPSDLGNEAKA